MKRFLGSLTAILTITTSQASTNLNGSALYGNPTPIVAPHRTVIRSVPAHVSARLCQFVRQAGRAENALVCRNAMFQFTAAMRALVTEAVVASDCDGVGHFRLRVGLA